MPQQEISKDLLEGFQKARSIAQEFAKTFYFASCFLSCDKRNAAYSVYAICRLSDEAVDENTGQRPQEQLEKIQEKINFAYATEGFNDQLLLAFKNTVEKYDIPKLYFDELISGMRMDLNKNRYANFEELKEYCYKVAGVIGLIMLKILGYKNSKAQNYAINLGIAMQLTNILRDIGEDFGRCRIYLPEDEMRKYGVTEENISEKIVNDNFKNLMQFQIQRAREFYGRCTNGIRMIPDLRSRFVVYAMKDIYSGILDDIEKNGYDVFSRRPHVTTAAKFGRALKILFAEDYL